MSEASNDKRICDLFTKGSHHRNLSVICLVQNLYYQGKEIRIMSLNSQYLVLFNNPWNQQQIMVLARQMYPGQSEKFLSTYRMATSKPFGYLLIDLSNLEHFMDMAAKGAYQLLQHHICRDYKTSQRGNGMGGVHHRHNDHKLYLIPKMDEIEHVKPDDDRSSKCNKVICDLFTKGSHHRNLSVICLVQNLYYQ